MDVYDFILFENFYLAYNHYKDICLIAQLLKANGYSVAIADVFKEGESCIVDGVPHITFSKKCSVDIRNLYSCKTIIIRSIINNINKRKIDNYLVYVMREIKGHYRHLYAGSYFIYMTTGWLKEIPSTSCAFFWGLRSARLTDKRNNAKRLRSYFDKHENLKFFVSDEIIYKEFIDKGVSSSRLVIRPERFVTDIKPISTKNQVGDLHLLTIGSIRKQKRVELCIDAIKRSEINNVFYTIAGNNKDDNYEMVISEHRKCMTNVIRLNYRIPEKEYNELIGESDYLVLCDEQQKSSVTNGTMNEALLRGVPIIAPNYNPYKYYIERYNIGILYDPMDITSLVRAISKAFNYGRSYFSDKITVYQKTLLFESVSEKFGEDIKVVL